MVTLSTAYEGTERWDEAAEAALQAIAIDNEIGNRQGVALGQIRLGSVQLALGNLDEAQSLFQISLEQNVEIQSRPSIRQSLEAFSFLCASAR